MRTGTWVTKGRPLRFILLCAFLAILIFLFGTALRKVEQEPGNSPSLPSAATCPAPPPILALMGGPNSAAATADGEFSFGPYNLKNLESLKLDARTEAEGCLWIELVSLDGRPVAHFSKDDLWQSNRPLGTGISGDFPMTNRVEVRWGRDGKRSLADVPATSSDGNKNYLLRVILRSARLFSCSFESRPR